MSEAVEGEIVNRPTSIRLTKYDETIVKKLEAAFHNAHNIQEACYYADISKTTFYNWLAEDDNFSYRMSVAQGKVNMKAKEIVAQAIAAGDASVALRYLMLRDPDFKPKVENTGDPDVAETRNSLKEAINAISKHDPSVQPTTANDGSDVGVVAPSPTDIS